MKQENRKTGGIGESLAVDFLKKKGFGIVERNFATKFGEIDMVAVVLGRDGRMERISHYENLI